MRKPSWNTSTLPSSLDGPTATVIYTERTPSGPARVEKIINRRPTERSLALDNSLYVDNLQGVWAHRASMPRRHIRAQRQERAKTWAYAAGTVLCFAAIGVMLAWRG